MQTYSININENKCWSNQIQICKHSSAINMVRPEFENEANLFYTSVSVWPRSWQKWFLIIKYYEVSLIFDVDPFLDKNAVMWYL